LASTIAGATLLDGVGRSAHSVRAAHSTALAHVSQRSGGRALQMQVVRELGMLQTVLALLCERRERCCAREANRLDWAIATLVCDGGWKLLDGEASAVRALAGAP
jgi:hypothetical protein